MNFIRNLSSRSSRKSTVDHNSSVTRSQAVPNARSEAPPAYSAFSDQNAQHASNMSTRMKPDLSAAPTSTSATTTADSPFAFLGQFDTIFLIDDSGSMAGRNWQETSDALSAISPIITEQDADGIDIYFLNHRNTSQRNGLGGYSNVTSPAKVHEIFRAVRPSAGTPTGTRLNAILKTYLADLSEATGKKNQQSRVKPLNIIVITDGMATDDVESVIISAAKKLDKMGAEPWQVGIQFFQVGNDKAAADDLRDLDDGLAGEHDIRDMVDTVPWSGVGGAALTADGIMKVTMGAINRRLDRKRNTDERLRQR